MVFGRGFGIVNPTRWMGSILRFWIVLPLVPGFPLVGPCWWKAGQRIGIHTGSTRCGMMDLDDSVDVPTMQGEV